MFWLKEDMFWPTEECSGQPKHYMFQAKEALLCPKEECSEPCHSSPTWGAINYFLFSLQNMFPICSTSAPHVSLKIGSVPQKTLFPIYTGHIVPQTASLPMDISNIMCLLALLLCCTYLSLIQNQIGAAVLFKILAFQARRHNWIYCLNNTWKYFKNIL